MLATSSFDIMNAPCLDTCQPPPDIGIGQRKSHEYEMSEEAASRNFDACHENDVFASVRYSDSEKTKLPWAPNFNAPRAAPGTGNNPWQK